MPAFSFEALDAQGQTRKGLLEADTAKSARGMLRAQGLVPMSVELVQTGQNTAGGSSALGQRLFTRPVFGATALAIWTRQLAGLVSSGLPLERALTALSEEADDDRQSHLVAALRVVGVRAMGAPVGVLDKGFWTGAYLCAGQSHVA